MDGLIERRTTPKDEVSEPVVPHDRVWGSEARELNTADREVAAQETVRDREFARAKEQLSKLTYVQVMDLLHSMPVGMLELYLLIEECGENRDEVLRYFPKPGVRARERWLPQTLAAVDA